MPKISLVEPQRKNPRRYNIYLDGIFAFGADEDLVVDQRLIVGKEVSGADLEQLLYEAEVGKMMERMYRLFNIRQRSEKEIRNCLGSLSYKRKLKGQEEISQSSVDLVVERLKQKRLLDDEEFARAWVDARRKLKKKGKIALKIELIQKGIDKEIINKVLEESGDFESEAARASQALEKRVPRWRNLPDQMQKKKAYEYLARLGFEYGVICEVVEKILKRFCKYELK